MTPEDRAMNLWVRLFRENNKAALAFEDGDTYWLPIATAIRDAVAAEQDRCCKLIYGHCGSDTVAERTVQAIRKGDQ